MFKEFFKFALKVMNKRRANTAITIIGLVITSSTIAFFFTVFHKFTQAEGFMLRGDRIIMDTYAVRYKENTNHGSGLNYKYIKDFVEPLPEVVASTIANSNANSHWKNDERISANLGFVDDGFDDVFNLDIIAGSFFTKEQNDNQEKVILLSRKTAMQLFGRVDIVGETTDVFADYFTIIGVYENIPEIYSTSFMGFSFDELIPLTHDPIKDRALTDRGYSYSSAILLESADQVPSVLQKLHENAQSYTAYEERNHFTHPFTMADLFLKDIIGHRGQVINFQLRNIFFAIVLLSSILIVITVINLSNLQFTIILNRIIEVGVRQSFGAYNRQLFEQFSTESLINTGIATVLSLALLYGDLHLFTALDLFSNTQFEMGLLNVLICIFITVLIGFLTLLFPVIKLFKSKPAHSLRGVIA